MNMILKKRLANRRGHAGFTLVEVIVVLVILAILAAIAIPALTGYIDKAEDKKYIMEARDCAVAFRTVMDEAYAEGMFGSTSGAAFAASGAAQNLFGTQNHTRAWVSTDIDKYYTSIDEDDKDMAREASKLMGKDFSSKGMEVGSRHWQITFLGSYPDSTLFNADGFIWLDAPEGAGAVGSSPRIIVTYKMKRLEIPRNGQFNLFWRSGRIFDNAVYDPNAGYEVYHLIK
jgi:prepilin-type N-terminal cleavage/methylation domain-containing protein